MAVSFAHNPREVENITGTLVTRRDRPGYWLDLGLIPYSPAFDIQEQVLEARIKDQLPSTIILQEVPSVFTIGRTGSRSNILASHDELQRLGIGVLDVNRGGDITYHGPGQLIVSPLLYLGDIDLNANQYLHRLEDLVMDLLSTYGISTHKKNGYPGVWREDAKIGSVGIAIKHGYTFHGFALNISLDLTPFSLINPCGVSRMPVTSLCQILGRDIPVSEVKKRLRETLAEMFSLKIGDISLEELRRSLA